VHQLITCIPTSCENTGFELCELPSQTPPPPPTDASWDPKLTISQQCGFFSHNPRDICQVYCPDKNGNKPESELEYEKAILAIVGGVLFGIYFLIRFAIYCCCCLLKLADPTKELSDAIGGLYNDIKTLQDILSKADQAESADAMADDAQADLLQATYEERVPKSHILQAWHHKRGLREPRLWDFKPALEILKSDINDLSSFDSENTAWGKEFAGLAEKYGIFTYSASASDQSASFVKDGAPSAELL